MEMERSNRGWYDWYESDFPDDEVDCLESPVTLMCMCVPKTHTGRERTSGILIETPGVEPLAMRKLFHSHVIKYLEYRNHFLNVHYSSSASGKCHITLLYRRSTGTQRRVITASLLHVHV